MDVKEKITLSLTDIQEIMGCGMNSTYKLITDAKQNNLFIIKQIGRKYYIPAESFWNWFNNK